MPFWDPMVPDELAPRAGADLRFRWRLTWSERDDDFCASDPEINVGSRERPSSTFGRTYATHGGPQRGRWWWGAHGTAKLADGFAETATEAARLIEGAYLRWKADLTPDELGKLRLPS
jgi:hypothetical protein